jgi:hypothetical protein
MQIYFHSSKGEFEEARDQTGTGRRDGEMGGSSLARHRRRYGGKWVAEAAHLLWLDPNGKFPKTRGFGAMMKELGPSTPGSRHESEWTLDVANLLVVLQDLSLSNLERSLLHLLSTSCGLTLWLHLSPQIVALPALCIHITPPS